ISAISHVGGILKDDSLTICSAQIDSATLKHLVSILCSWLLASELVCQWKSQRSMLPSPVRPLHQNLALYRMNTMGNRPVNRSSLKGLPPPLIATGLSPLRP